MADFDLDTITTDTDGPAADTDELFGSPAAGTPKPYSFAGIKTWIKAWIVKGDVGLGNVDNTSDVVKAKTIAPLLFFPKDNLPPTSNYATLDTRNGHPVLDFDTTTGESAIFEGVLPASYGGGGLTVDVAYSMTSATTGTCGFTFEIERVGTAQDTDSDSFASAQTITAGTVSGTSGVIIVLTGTVTSGANMDSLAAGEQFRVRITRDVANDTATGDAELHWVRVRET